MAQNIDDSLPDSLLKRFVYPQTGHLGHRMETLETEYGDSFTTEGLDAALEAEEKSRMLSRELIELTRFHSFPVNGLDTVHIKNRNLYSIFFQKNCGKGCVFG